MCLKQKLYVTKHDLQILKDKIIEKITRAVTVIARNLVDAIEETKASQGDVFGLESDCIPVITSQKEMRDAFAFQQKMVAAIMNSQTGIATNEDLESLQDVVGGRLESLSKALVTDVADEIQKELVSASRQLSQNAEKIISSKVKGALKKLDTAFKARVETECEARVADAVANVATGIKERMAMHIVEGEYEECFSMAVRSDRDSLGWLLTKVKLELFNLGISRALQNWEPDADSSSSCMPVRLTDIISDLVVIFHMFQLVFLTRDSRVVERKKPGKTKARKSFRWVKRYMRTISSLRLCLHFHWFIYLYRGAARNFPARRFACDRPRRCYVRRKRVTEEEPLEQRSDVDMEGNSYNS
ncbi:hypothetical protein Bca52824_029233 [Brassica carinata]|uniref:Uncharacterized protein n=1 Tax=Brassica carinata TaxID=52824 RepID=A0A8X7VDK7_BRACI|nr:hypothetical protein Bca52824_029233 [Brassica carinata]